MTTEKTPASPTPPPAEKPLDVRSEQDKGGKDPVNKAQPSPGPVQTIEDQDIGPRDPYPTGNPPKPVADEPPRKIP